jgi:ABC-type Na+ efflux pump permease subunit
MTMLESLRLLPTNRSEWLIPVSVALSIVLLTGAGIAIDTVAANRPRLLQIIYQPVLFPGMFTALPFIFAVVNVFRDGSLVISVLVGVAPGLAFLLLGVGSELTGIGSGGDAPAWALAVVFSQVGLVCALVGTAVGVISLRVYEWV